MECRDENDIIPWLQFICLFAFKFPVGIVYQNKNTGTTNIKLALTPKHVGLAI